jgi:hypothetical protein
MKALRRAKLHVRRVGATEGAISLAIVSEAESDFVASAWLVAVICTAADAGKTAGAV